MLQEIISDLEMATAPDRDLDRAIHAAIDGNTIVPYYTSSVVAASTLVPKDCVADTQKRQINSAVLDGGERAWAQIESRDGRVFFAGAVAPTVPLALCIAALKARDALNIQKQDTGQ